MGGPLGRGWGSPLWAFGSRRGGERGEHRCRPEDLEGEGREGNTDVGLRIWGSGMG